MRDIMSGKVVTIGADETLRVVHDIMEMGNVRHLPVVRRGALVGVVSQRDLFHASLSNLIGIPADEQDVFLEGVTISEVMSSPALTVAPTTSLREAARLMADRKFGCLPVSENGKLVGIVTETDLLRCCADMLPETDS